MYKLVPGLQSEEQRRRQEFIEELRRLGLPTGEESDSDEEDKRKRTKRLKNRGGFGAAGNQKNGSDRNGLCGSGKDKKVNGGNSIRFCVLNQFAVLRRT